MASGSLGAVSRSYVIYIGLLAAFWGASYMFIKVADRAFEPTTMIMLRLLIASSRERGRFRSRPPR